MVLGVYLQQCAVVTVKVDSQVLLGGCAVIFCSPWTFEDLQRILSEAEHRAHS